MHPFEALADPVRRRLVEVLASGEHTSGQLADAVGREFLISRTAVSKHLRLLRDSFLVDVRAEEKWRWYRLDRTGLESLEDAVADLRAKYETAIGWDVEEHGLRDPLVSRSGHPRVPFKGPGRPSRRGRRGRRSEAPEIPSPDGMPPWRHPFGLPRAAP